MNSIFKYVKSRLGNRSTVTELQCDGVPVVDDESMSEVLNNQYCSVFCHDNGVLPLLPAKSDVNISDSLIVTRASVVNSIRKLSNSFSSGIDGIPAWFYKTFSEQLAIPLQKIFQASFATGVLPQEWKFAIITPVYKGAKHKSTEAASYRPISLTCIACRVMEHILKNCIVDHCNSMSLFSNHQHGFRGKRSTETQLLECLNDWTSFLNNGEPVDIFYLDISKAFDTVSHPKLIFKLAKYGITGKFLKWIESFLSGRKQAVRVNDAVSCYEPVCSGVPQGSVLGPLLFLLYINDLPDVCKNSSLKMFADDSKVYFKCGTPSDRRKLFTDVYNVFEWFEQNQLKVAVEKCAVLHLGTSNPCFPYRINGSVIPSVNTVKDIGIIMSDNMKFSIHCENVASKAFKMSNMFFRAFKSRNLDFVRSFFVTYVRSLIENGSSVWNPHLMKDIRLLESVQRKFTKRIPALKSLNYSTRLSIMKLDSLEGRRLYKDMTFCYNIINGYVDIEFDEFFQFADSGLRRNRHSQTLKVPNCKINSRKYNFSSRVVSCWNSLPQRVIDSRSTDVFKRSIRELDFSRFLKYSE